MNAGIDENGRQTIMAISNVDGKTIAPIYANPTSHAVHVDDNTTGSDLGNNGGNAMLDENSRQVITALSSTGDGSIIEVYVNDSTGALLVNSQ